MKLRIILFIIALLAPITASGASLTIVSYNVDGNNFSSDKAPKYESLIENSSPDVLVLQELLNEKQLGDFKRYAKIPKWNSYISDFTNHIAGNDYSKLEVGIVSKHNLTARFEADPRTHDDSDSDDVKLEKSPLLPKDQRKYIGVRGYLWGEIASKKLVVIAVHLKSAQSASGGRDERNSFKREAVTAAIIERIIAHKEKHENWNYVIAGDFNVSPGDYVKVGVDLNHRCEGDCSGYDQTHALLGGGLVNGFVMRNLTIGLGRSYTDTQYIPSPIDNVYAMGPFFDEAVKVTSERMSTYGSDHFAIRVTIESKK